jgi:hypothetical protein
MVPEIDLSQQRPAQFVFSQHVAQKLDEIRAKTPAKGKSARAQTQITHAGNPVGQPSVAGASRES